MNIHEYQAKELFKEYNVKTLAITKDVSLIEDVKNSLDLILDKFASIDIVINNAAINPIHDSLENMTEAIYDKMMDVNLKSAFDFGNLCFPYLKEKKDGSIINIASVEGLKPTFGLGIYSMTKSALIMLTKVQAKFVAKCNSTHRDISLNF